MKKIIAIAALAGLTAVANAQLSSLPPSSLAGDGVPVQASDSNWWSSPLHSYDFASNDNLGTPNMHSPDNVLGLSWAASLNPQVASDLAAINSSGGTVRIIFVGESAGWLNGFGYTYDGNPAGSQSFTVFNQIQAVSPADVTFGDHVDVDLAPGNASTFDVWLNAVGAMGSNPPPGPSWYGGVYTGIHPSNSNPFLWSGNALWAQSPLWVNTQTNSGTQTVATYLLGFEDWRLDRGADQDFNDLAVAFQFFRPDGTPFTPVPEPSTYGLIGAVALVGLVARRRFAKK